MNPRTRNPNTWVVFPSRYNCNDRKKERKKDQMIKGDATIAHSLDLHFYSILDCWMFLRKTRVFHIARASAQRCLRISLHIPVLPNVILPATCIIFIYNLLISISNNNYYYYYQYLLKYHYMPGNLLSTYIISVNFKRHLLLQMSKQQHKITRNMKSHKNTSSQKDNVSKNQAQRHKILWSDKEFNIAVFKKLNELKKLKKII